MQPEEKPNTVTLYHGTDSVNARQILKDGAIKPDVSKWDVTLYMPSKGTALMSQSQEPGYVYATPFLDTAKAYAFVKSIYYRVPKSHSFWVEAWSCTFIKRGSVYRPESKPAVIEFEYPLDIGVSPDSESMAGIRIKGPIPVESIKTILPVLSYPEKFVL